LSHGGGDDDVYEQLIAAERPARTFILIRANMRCSVRFQPVLPAQVSPGAQALTIRRMPKDLGCNVGSLEVSQLSH